MDYLEDWIFGETNRHPNASLPVELRVAMLDFVDSRIVMENLSSARLDLRSTSIARHSQSPSLR
jgi:hypothetical protein